MVQQIGPKALHAKIEAGEPLYLIDVRQPWEHEKAALPGSILIPLAELSARAAEIAPPDNALVVAYCHHGIRSLTAAQLLERLGFRPAASLVGGIDAWAVEVDPTMPRY